ncbi:MAG: hypothetical protein LUG55_01375 [Clostridiales bacterium]|nr:hypothetical protein [Clostridiales bacterium]
MNEELHHACPVALCLQKNDQIGNKEPLNKWTRANCEEICARKRRKIAVILTDFKIFRRIYGANLLQGAEVHLFRGS